MAMVEVTIFCPLTLLTTLQTLKPCTHTSIPHTNVYILKVTCFFLTTRLCYTVVCTYNCICVIRIYYWIIARGAVCGALRFTGKSKSNLCLGLGLGLRVS